MTDQPPDHTVFDELAAGHAVHALEPADEQRFLRHAGQCARCQRSVAGFRAVAAALAETAPPAEPSARLGERILAVARADPGGQGRTAAPPAGPGTPDPGATRPGEGARDPGSAAPGTGAAAHRAVPLRRRTGRGQAGRGQAGLRWRKPAAAAAAVLIAGGGIWAGLAATAGGPAQPLAACARPHACAQVTLTGAATHRTAAKVVIHEGVAWMEPARMPANPAGEIYVLWQITGAAAPLAVGSFDVRAGAASPIRIGGLPAPYPGTRAFAVSLEHGRTIPARPSAPVAVGRVS